MAEKSFNLLSYIFMNLLFLSIILDVSAQHFCNPYQRLIWSGVGVGGGVGGGNMKIKTCMKNLMVTFGCKDAWTPWLVDMFDWSVKIRSIQEELFFCTSVGSFISCWNPSEEVCANNLVPSVLLMSLDHQEVNLPLKSPVITD